MNNLRITKLMLSPSKYKLKSPYTMYPTEITIHDTYNNASAMNEVSYMIGNNNVVSFHYAVDETRAVQGIPLNRNAWHSGDGNGRGNRKSIGIEIARSTSDYETYMKSVDNASKLVALLMKQFPHITINDIHTHKDRSGKNCPHRMLSLGIWQDGTFKRKVLNYLNEETVKVAQVKEDKSMTELGEKTIAIISVTKNGINSTRDMQSARVLRQWLYPSYNPVIMETGLNTFDNIKTNYIIALGGAKNEHSSYCTHYVSGKTAEDTYEKVLDFVRNGEEAREKYKIK